MTRDVAAVRDTQTDRATPSPISGTVARCRRTRIACSSSMPGTSSEDRSGCRPCSSRIRRRRLPTVMEPDPIVVLARRRGDAGGQRVRALRSVVGASRQRSRQARRSDHRRRDRGLRPGAGRQRRPRRWPASGAPRISLPRSGRRRGTDRPGSWSTWSRRFVATRFIGLFETTIQDFVALATLMPIVASVGGNTGKPDGGARHPRAGLRPARPGEPAPGHAQGAHRQRDQRADVGRPRRALLPGCSTVTCGSAS